MRTSGMNWMQVEQQLQGDQRAVLPIGSTEQQAYLSLSVDAILAERVAVEAAEPLGVPVYPVLAYGIAPHFRACPGTVTLRPETHRRVIAEILDCLAGDGVRRILVVNGHGGDTPVDPDGSHASGVENFPWTRLPPDEQRLAIWRAGVAEAPEAIEGPWS